MNPNLLVQYLQKPAAEFTRQDIIRYCEENEIEFGKLLLEIREKCGTSLREMSKIFNINKDKINIYIKL